MISYSIILKKSSLDDVHHDFVGAFENLMNSKISQESLNWVLLQISVPTVHLESIVDDVEALISGDFLGHSTVHGIIRLLLGKHTSSMPHHQSRAFQFNGHFSKLELQVLIICKGFSKLLSSLDIVLGNIETLSSTTD